MSEPRSATEIAGRSQYGILIPCPQDEFTTFISGLLGKPQIAKGSFTGTFCVKLEDIDNFFHLIDQRVTEQNRGNLVQFTALVKFDDGTSIELPSLEYLHSYSEVRPLTSTGVALTWVYIVNFANSAITQRQQIEVEVETQSVRRSRFLPPINVMEYFETSPNISYRISYTARTWGADIENLLIDHIQALLQTERRPLRTFIRRWGTYVLNLFALLFFSLWLGVGILGANYLQTARYAKYVDIQRSNIVESAKITKMIDYLAADLSGATSAALTVAIITFLGIGLAICYFAASELVDGARANMPRETLNGQTELGRSHRAESAVHGIGGEAMRQGSFRRRSTPGRRSRRRDRFLGEMELVVPRRLVERLRPLYPRKGERGRPPPIGTGADAAIYSRQWYGPADEGLEDALYDSQAPARFCRQRLGAWSFQFRTRRTLLKFRAHWLERFTIKSGCCLSGRGDAGRSVAC